MPKSVVTTSVVRKLRLSQMPVEWLDSGSWRLPSGKALAEFALQAGFLAPPLFRTERGKTGSSAVTKPSEIGASVTQTRGKFGKGDGR